MTTATITHCSDCGAPLSDRVEVWTGSCEPCTEAWFTATVAAAPRTMHPLSDDIIRIVAKHHLIGVSWPRERDDFEDASDTDSEPLPASGWHALGLATQDRLTSRQQTGMAGDRS